MFSRRLYLEEPPMKNIAYRILVPAVLLVTFMGCGDTKSLPGNYRLERWEDGKTYYLLGPPNQTGDVGGGGLIGGLVDRMAWDGEIICAERYATFRGDPDGWMIVDIKSGKISGPVSKLEFDAVRIRRRLEVKEASVAWDEL